MIESFGNALAEDLFDDRRTKTTRSFPPELRRALSLDQTFDEIIRKCFFSGINGLHDLAKATVIIIACRKGNECFVVFNRHYRV